MIKKIKEFYLTNLGDFKYYFFSKFFIGFSWLIILKVISNNISPLAFSEYSLLLIFTTFFSSINTMWISSSYIRLYHSVEQKKLYFSSIKLLTFSTIIFSVFYIISYYILAKNGIFNKGKSIFISTFLYFLSYSFYLFYIGKYSGERNLRKYSLVNILNFSLIVISIFFLKKSLTPNVIFNIYFVINIITLVFILFFEKIKITNIKIEKELFTEVFKYGFPILLINIFVILHSSIDQFLLKFYNHQKDLGIYAANYAIADKSILIFTNIYVSSFAPRLFQSYSLNIKETFLTYKKIILFYIVMIIPITLVVVLFYKDIFGLVLSSEFLNPKIGNLILFGAMFNGASQILSEYFTLKKSTLLLAAIYFVPVVINFALNYFLIPIYKIDSAVYSTIFTYFILFILLLSGVYFTSRKNV